MAQTKQQIQATLAAAGMHPRHRFGQNFMIDGNLVRTIADAAAIAPEDTVIEVGPGTGTLTEELLSRAGRVIAVEIDRDLAGQLRTAFADRPTFELIEGDALQTKHELNADLLRIIRQTAETSVTPDAAAEAADCGRVVGASPAAKSAASKPPGEAALSPLKLVANLPYNIASPLVVELLRAGVQTLVFTVQKEVADRLRGKADSEDYGPLTAVVQLLADVEVLRTLPPQAFWPPPKIDSALVRLTRRDRLGEHSGPFGRFAHQLFSFRRKTLKKALDMAGYAVAPESVGLDGTKRAEAFSPEQLLTLYRAAIAAS